MRNTLRLILVLICPILAVAQPTSAPLQVGLGLMGVSYVGDLTGEETSVQRFHPGGNIAVQFDGDRFLQPQFNVGFGSFTEQSDLVTLPATQDVSPNNFVSTSFFYTDLRLRGRFFRKKAVQPVLGAGLGLTFFSPRDADGNYLGENIFTRLREEQYNTTVPSFVGLLGVSARLNPIVSIGLDYSYRMVNSDYLDNIGMLGNRAGNDRLHGLEFSLRFTLRPQSKTRQEPESEQIMVPDTALLVGQQEVVSELEANDLSANVPDTSDVRPLIKSVETISQASHVPVAPTVINPTALKVEKDWVAIEEAALLQRKYVYYRVREGDTLLSLLTHFHVREKTARLLNHLVNNEIYPDMLLRLPDMGVEFP